MHARFALLLAIVALAACEDGPSGNLRCEHGPDVFSDSVSELVEHDLTCTRDDDCVLLAGGVSCVGFETFLCGVPMHRETAARWNPKQVCAEIERLPDDGLTACSVGASCAASEPVCDQGRCTARH